MSILFIIFILFLQPVNLEGPEPKSTGAVFISEKSHVRFFSEAPLENIEAASTKMRAALNLETGILLFVIPINSFEFEKQLMEKHFNEQYLESDKYPEARFEGKFTEAPIDLNASSEAWFEGLLSMHGETNKVSGKAMLQMNGKNVHGKSIILVRLEDYKIKVPRMVIKNIAEEVEITIQVDFIPQLNP
jgi:polyisoprenoid-binding protein YceI